MQKLLGQVLNNYINAQYMEKHNKQIIGKLGTGAKDAEELVNRIKEKTVQLNTIHGKQKILALNASIEAARAGRTAKALQWLPEKSESCPILSMILTKISISLSEKLIPLFIK